MSYTILDSKVIAEKPIFPSKAGTTKENPFLLGLEFKIIVNARNATSVVLYASDLPENEDNAFVMLSTEENVWYLTCVAGEDFTSLDMCSDSNANFNDGVKFYFRIKINGSVIQAFDRIFWVRDVKDLITFTAAQVHYESPFPVLVDALVVPCSVGLYALNQAGNPKYCGAETVEVINTPSAPSSGEFVIELEEQVVSGLSEITLINRDNASSIPGYIPPPGCPDFSRYFAFITFRLRAKLNSLTYRDIDVILFPAKTCAVEMSVESEAEEYGWDSNGSETVSGPSAAPELTILLPPTTTVPPPYCSSSVTLTTDTPVNQYSPQIVVQVYDAETGGNLLYTNYDAIPVGGYSIKANRSDFGGDIENPIAGWFQLVELSPDRTSTNRIEAVCPGCAVVPVEITTITPTQITTTPGSRILYEDKTYTIKVYPSKYSQTPTVELPGVYADSHTISISPTVPITGWWELIEDGIVITSPKFEASITPETLYLYCIMSPSAVYKRESGVWNLESALSLSGNESAITCKDSNNFYLSDDNNNFYHWDRITQIAKASIPDSVEQYSYDLAYANEHIYAAVHDRIYAGSDPPDYGGIYQYSIALNTWSLIKTAPQSTAVCAYQDKIYSTEEYFQNVIPIHDRPAYIHYYNGSSWVDYAAGAEETLLDIHCENDSYIVACGYDLPSKSGIIYESTDGISWTKTVSSRFGYSGIGDFQIKSIQVIGNEWIACGIVIDLGALTTDLFFIYSNGGSPILSVVDSELYYYYTDLFATSLTDIWVVVHGISSTKTKIFHYNGSSWTNEKEITTSISIYQPAIKGVQA